MPEEDENSTKNEEQNEEDKEGINRRQVTPAKKQKEHSGKLRSLMKTWTSTRSGLHAKRSAVPQQR